MDTTLASIGTSPVAYAVAFALLAWLATRAIRLVVEGAIHRDRHGIIDRTTARFALQFVRVLVYTVALTAFFHVVPQLRALGSVLLAGVSVASVIFGLAASNTLSNLIAGVSLLLYFPYRVGDVLRLQVSGTIETATIESINLGYTRLTAQAAEVLIVPNSVLIQSSVALLQAARAVAAPHEATPPKG